jgi:hypothetical protein
MSRVRPTERKDLPVEDQQNRAPPIVGFSTRAIAASFRIQQKSDALNA